jgi:hypothetical protein
MLDIRFVFPSPLSLAAAFLLSTNPNPAAALSTICNLPSMDWFSIQQHTTTTSSSTTTSFPSF